MFKNALYAVLLIVIVLSSCKKDAPTNIPDDQKKDNKSITGKWTLISDSVATTGDYYVMVNGVPNFPVTGNLPAQPGDYFQFNADGSFTERWNGMDYPYPCTYTLTSDSTMTTNNVLAPLTNVKYKLTSNTLTITGHAVITTGKITDIFYLKR